MLSGLVLASQRKEAEYQHHKKEVAATKLQKFYRGFRYNHPKYLEITFLGNYLNYFHWSIYRNIKKVVLIL